MKWENPYLKWGVWIILTIAFILAAAVMMGNAAERLAFLCDDMAPPDLVLLLDKAYIHKFFSSCSKQGLDYYREIAIYQDILYPFTYSAFMAISMINFYQARKPSDYRFLGRILLFPLIALVSDIFENILFVKLSFEFPDFNPLTYFLLRVFHGLKWLAAFSSFGVILYLLITWLRFVLVRKQVND